MLNCFYSVFSCYFTLNTDILRSEAFRFYSHAIPWFVFKAACMFYDCYSDACGILVLLIRHTCNNSHQACQKSHFGNLSFCRAMLCKCSLCHHMVSVCLSVTFVHSIKMNKHIFKLFSPSGSQAILVFPYQMAWQYSDWNPSNGGVESRWGRQKSPFWANIWLRGMLWTLQWPASINTIVGRYLAIDRCLLKLVLSTDGRPSSGVSQSRCKSVYGTESHAPVNMPKRREHNLIYARV